MRRVGEVSLNGGLIWRRCDDYIICPKCHCRVDTNSSSVNKISIQSDFLRILKDEFGAGGRTRTDMSVTSPDFESGAYTNFATPAVGREIIWEGR